MTTNKTLLLANGTIITFNEEQFEGIQKIIKWLDNGIQPFFTLAGFAGTGKTTIVKKIIDDYLKVIAVSAPTHKAKKVISSMTGVEGVTLHALLGLRPDVDLADFNPNNPKFSPIAKAKLNDFSLVIVDEASMINQELFDLIKKELKYFDTKVLFIGDPAQIPPVGEPISPIFTLESMDIHWLTKVERQNQDNPLVEVHNTLRDNLIDPNGGLSLSPLININKNNCGYYIYNDKNAFRERLRTLYTSREAKENINFVKLIAWRNITIQQSNKIIRSLIYGKTPAFIEQNEILMCYRSISSANGKFNIIENSTDYRVIHVSKRKLNKKFGIFGYNVTLAEDDFIETKIFIVDTSDKNNLHNYAEMHDHLKQQGIANKKEWKKYYAFRRQNIIMQNISVYRDGRKRDKNEVIIKDMDYGYAITAHKSQGSTYKNVLILENDINLNQNIIERNQIKYVAITRPTNTATILIS